MAPNHPIGPGPKPMTFVVLIVVLAAFVQAGGAAGAETVASVVDGDTFDLALAPEWGGRHDGRGARVRVMGVDTPELFRPQCPAELEAARAARDAVVAWLEAADWQVVLTPAAGPGQPWTTDRYGRLLAWVWIQPFGNSEGFDLAARLIAEGLGRPYDGGRREGWCDP